MENEHSRWGEALIEGLKEAIAYQRGELTNVRVHSVEVTARSAHVERPPWYAPFLIREIRHKLSVSQAIFAEMLGVSASSVRAWEQGKREPDGPARRLLQIAELHPEVLKAVVGEIYPAIEPAETPLPKRVEAPARSADKERLAADTGSSRRRRS
ncbi:MAG TPA: helix-turn-helix domain-containing protein [Longimicrobium sp.]|nr:helix-turn-helix domain-containing protein [Longimicrobium sp.]